MGLAVDYFKNLPVGHITTADDAENNENRDEKAFGPQPFVEVVADKKTKSDAPGHRQTELHYNR
jgi:hypothetical protein